MSYLVPIDGTSGVGGGDINEVKNAFDASQAAQDIEIAKIASISSFDVKQDIPINKPPNSVYLDKSLNIYGSTDKGFPKEPVSIVYAGTIYTITDEATFDTAYTSAVNGDRLLINAPITFTTVKTIAKEILIYDNTGTNRITFSTAGVIFNVTVSNVKFQNLTINNSNTSSVTCLISFTGTSNLGCDVSFCKLETNESAIITEHKDITIRDNQFIFVGTPDSHRYIFITGCLGNCFISRNIFNGNGTNNTQCIIITNTLASKFLNGSIIVSENVTATAPCQRLMMIEIPLTASNVSMYFSKNIITSTDFIIHYSNLALEGVKQLWLVDNNHTLNPIATSSKGLIGIDTPTTGVISFNTSLYASGNTIPTLRTDYSDLINQTANQPKLITYSTTKFTPGLQTYNVIIPLITKIVSDHTQFSNIGVNTHAQIDTAIAKIPTLESKTSIFDTQARLTNNLLLDNDNAYDIGDVNTRVRSIYAIGRVVATLFRGVSFAHPISEIGITIDQLGNIAFDSNLYTGLINGAAISLKSDGTLQKTSATISVTGDIGAGTINATGDVNCVNLSATQALRSNDWFNLTNNAGINIAPTAAGTTLFRGTDYADGNAHRALVMDAAGTVQKTGVVMYASGDITAKEITCHKIIGNTAGQQSDLVLVNQTDKGVTIKHSGEIVFTSDQYAKNGGVTKSGQILSIIDDNGTIGPIVSSGSGDVVGPATATDNALTRFDTTTGKLIQSSGVSLSDNNEFSNVNRISLNLGGVVSGLATTFEGSIIKGNNPDPGLELNLVNQGNVGLAVASDGIIRLTGTQYQQVGSLTTDALGRVSISTGGGGVVTSSAQTLRRYQFPNGTTMAVTIKLWKTGNIVTLEHGDCNILNSSNGATFVQTTIPIFPGAGNDPGTPASATQNANIISVSIGGNNIPNVPFGWTLTSNGLMYLAPSVSDTWSTQFHGFRGFTISYVAANSDPLVPIPDEVSPSVITPVLSSNTSNPTFLITRSSIFVNDPGYESWKLFDGNQDGYWASGQGAYSTTAPYIATNANTFNTGTSTVNGAWVKITLNETKRFNYYRLGQTTIPLEYQATDFTIYGSNDDINYTVVNQQTNYNYSGTNGVWMPNIPVGTQLYKYIVFQGTKLSGNGGVLDVMNLEFGFI